MKKENMTFALSLLIISIIMVTIMIFSVGLKTNIITTFFIIAIEIELVGLILKFNFSELEKSGFEYILKALPAFFILLSVGAMVSMWIAAGVVPTLIYAGLKLISPKIVLTMAMVLTSLAALATGTSYGSIATVGVAMMGIGASMNIPLEIVAGAVICGAFFGDSMSPMSDTTNITSAATQTPLMKEIKHMLYVQIPAYVISLIIFTIIGFKYGNSNMDTSSINTILEILSNHFNIGFVAIIPAVIVIVMLLLKIPTFLSLAGGAFSGAIVALLYQKISIVELLTFLKNGYSIDTGFDVVDKILNRGGISSMYDMAILIILAMFISGLLSHMGVMDAFISKIVTKVKGDFSLILITSILAYFLSAFAGSFTLASVITSTFMLPLFEKRKLKSENLARTIQVTSGYGGVIIPWNGHALYASSTLGVATSAYAPYCFLTYLNPIILLLFAITGISMTRLSDEDYEMLKKEKED